MALQTGIRSNDPRISIRCLRSKVLDEVDGALHRLETWQGELQKMHGLNRQLLRNITGYARGVTACSIRVNPHVQTGWQFPRHAPESVAIPSGPAQAAGRGSLVAWLHKEASMSQYEIPSTCRWP